MTTKLVNGRPVECTPEEDAQLEAIRQATLPEMAAQQAQVARRAAMDAALEADATVSQFKSMTASQFDAWWAANILTPADAMALLRRLTLLIIRRLL
jgi:hypothetical protein